MGFGINLDASKWFGGLFPRSGDPHRDNPSDPGSNNSDYAALGNRVKAAEAAGIHPLYALNASLPTYQPSYQLGEQESSPRVGLSYSADRQEEASNTDPGEQAYLAKKRSLDLEASGLDVEARRMELQRMQAELALSRQRSSRATAAAVPVASPAVEEPRQIGQPIPDERYGVMQDPMAYARWSIAQWLNPYFDSLGQLTSDWSEDRARRSASKHH